MKNDKVYLTRLASAAGCGAKIGPKVLAQVVGKLPKFTDPMLLVGPETSDDAAVYKISDELAMIQTVDFFPPVVNDPYMYGQIAAANALSDVYAMGGIPKLALNVVAFPNCLGPEVLEQILRGGADKVWKPVQFLQEDIPSMIKNLTMVCVLPGMYILRKCGRIMEPGKEIH